MLFGTGSGWRRFCTCPHLTPPLLATAIAPARHRVLAVPLRTRRCGRRRLRGGLSAAGLNQPAAGRSRCRGPWSPRLRSVPLAHSQTKYSSCDSGGGGCLRGRCCGLTRRAPRSCGSGGHGGRLFCRAPVLCLAAPAPQVLLLELRGAPGRSLLLLRAVCRYRCLLLQSRCLPAAAVPQRRGVGWGPWRPCCRRRHVRGHRCGCRQVRRPRCRWPAEIAPPVPPAPPAPLRPIFFGRPAGSWEQVSGGGSVLASGPP